MKQRAEQRGEVALLRLLGERQRPTAVGVCWAWDSHDLGLRASCVLAPGEKASGLDGGLSDGAAKGPGSVSSLNLFPVPTLLVLFRHKYSLQA